MNFEDSTCSNAAIFAVLEAQNVVFFLPISAIEHVKKAYFVNFMIFFFEDCAGYSMSS